MTDHYLPATDNAHVPAALYKYVCAERVDILQSKKIRFTQPTATNDLFELKPIFDSMIPEEEFDSVVRPTDRMLEEALRRRYDNLPPDSRGNMTFDEMMNRVRSRPDLVDEAIRSSIPQVRAFAHDFTPTLRRMMTDGFSRMIGILSLTETPTNQAMWAHYADNHQGFVLTFDTANTFFHRRRSLNDDFHHLRKVIYMARTPAGRSLIKLTGNDIFFTKSDEWAYEREWRMISPLGSDLSHPPADDEVVLMDFPAAALREVTIGVRASGALRATLRGIVTSDSDLGRVRLQEAHVSDREPSIRIRDWTS